MSSKHFVNDPTHLVISSLHSLTLTNPAVALDRANKIVYRRPTDHASSHPTVSLVSGGGSGHEPSFAALVGPGMLAAAVAGTIFASPSTEQIRTAVASRVDPARGVLVVIMNYTGDVLNFGVAVEMARAAGLRVEMIVVGDDVGVGRAKGGKVGRRGIAGTVLVHKIAGALASAGWGLEDVAKVARLVADNLVSVGASLEHVHVPGRAGEMDESERVRNGEVELGMGIHNEPGCGREPADLPRLVAKMLSQLLDPNDEDRAFVHVNSNEVVLLVNNLGGVSPLELGAITAEVCAQLDASWGIRPVRVLSGAFMTSLNALGFSVTLLNVVNTEIGGPGMVDLLDAPAEVTGWSAPVRKHTWEAKNAAEMTGGNVEKEGGEARREGGKKRGEGEAEKEGEAGEGGEAEEGNNGEGRDEEDEEDEDMVMVEMEDEKEHVVSRPDDKRAQESGPRLDAKKAQAALTRALQRVVQVEPEITKFDTAVGDGDCGIGMKRGAEALLEHFAKSPLTGDVVVDLAALTSVVEVAMDGTSGALYAIFLNALTAAMRDASGSHGQVTTAVWARALQQASKALGKYTPARPGDRTLMDALVPFIETLAQDGSDIGKAAAAARRGADMTKGMEAKLGRSVYVGGRDQYERVPDPGACVLAYFFEGLAGSEGSGKRGA